MNKERLGLVLIFLSAFLFSVMGVFIKYASSVHHFPPTELVFLRAVFQGSIVILAMIITKQDDNHDDSNNNGNDNEEKKKVSLIWQPFGKPSVRNLVIARGAVGGFGFVCFFYAIALLPLGDAIALLSLHPVVTVLAAAIFLGEPIRPSHLIAAVASGVGAILITRPAFVFGTSNNDGGDPSTVIDEVRADYDNIISASDSDNMFVSSSSEPSLFIMNHAKTIGYIAAMTGTCCGSAVFCLMRSAGKSGAHTYQLVFSWATFGIFFSVSIGILLHITGTDGGQSWYLPPVSSASWDAWLCILGISTFGSAAHFLLNYAARIAPAGLASITRSSEIVWGYAWEVLMFSQIPRRSTVEGVLLVCLSIGIVAIQKVHDQQQPKQEQARVNIRNSQPIQDAFPNNSDEESGNILELHYNTNYGSTSEGIRK